MTYVLDSPVIVGKTTVAALTRSSISKSWSDGHVSMKVEKLPEILLFKREEQLTAIKPSGEPVTLQEVERLCPGAISRFEAASIDKGAKRS